MENKKRTPKIAYTEPEDYFPKELRKKLGIAACDPVEISSEGDKIILTKYSPVCHFCGSTEGVSEFKEKTICKKCIEEIKTI